MPAKTLRASQPGKSRARAVGVAEAGREIALSQAARKKDDPVVQGLVGEMDTELQAARFHPWQERRQYLFSGRVALGLDPVA